MSAVPARDVRDAWFRARWPAERARLATRAGRAGVSLQDAAIAAWVQDSGFPSVHALFAAKALDAERLRSATSEDVADEAVDAWWHDAPVRGSAPLPAEDASLLCMLEPRMRRCQEAMAAALRDRLGISMVAGRTVDAAVALLEPTLRHRLHPIVARAMLVELARARACGTLHGETPQARFACFVALQSQPEAAAEFRSRYPLLWRLVDEAFEHHAAAGITLLTHLHEDAAAIRTLPGTTDARRVVSISTPLGDPHDGRHVHAVTFEGGQRVIYKPRSLAPEAAFAGVVGLLEAHGLGTALRLPALLDRADHGWMEAVEAGDCADAAALARYFDRLGASIAVLHLMQATDLHHENLIAAGEHPVFVDLESMLNPMGRYAGEQHASDLTAETVIRTGLLPRMVGGHAEDVSGLNARAHATAERAVWLDAGTDTMRLGRARMAVDACPNLPRLDGVRMSAASARETILDGFTRAYRLIIDLRQVLEGDAGLLARLARMRCRYLFRPTLVYHSLLEASRHPAVAGDALRAEAVFDRLWRFVDDIPGVEAIVAFEQACLRRGDIPRIEHRPDSSDLLLGDAVLAGFFEQPGLARVRQRLARMGEQDLRRQRHVLSQGLAVARADGEPSARPACRPAPVVDWTPQRGLALATAIGDHLLALAVRDRHHTGWIAPSLGTDLQWYPTPVNGDLYAGVSGIGLFLLALARAGGPARFLEAACECARSLALRMARPDDATRGIGAFDGVCGEAYFLAALASATGDAGAWRQLRARLDGMRARIARDDAFDLVGGGAGAVLVLHALRNTPGATGDLETARAIGAHLLAHAQRGPGDACAWPAPGAAHGACLAGLGHGASGMALAFARLAHWDGDARWLGAMHGALAFERACFDPQARTWPDQRADRAGEAFSAWCHGAAGIGMARAVLLADGVDAPGLRADLACAIEATRRDGFAQDACLCHGDFGNIELWLLAAEVDADARAELPRVASRVVSHLAHNREALVEGCPHVGLMTGAAGIGYQLLRMADPVNVPSVLTLAPWPAMCGGPP